MNENCILNHILRVMKNLNFLIILYTSVMIFCGLQGYIQENTAMNFLAQVNTLPEAPWKIPVLTICLFGCCVLLMNMENIQGRGLVLKVCLELRIAVWISSFLGFSYTGMILLILADTIRYIPRTKGQIPFAVIIGLFYLLIDYDLITICRDIIPLDAYLAYYQKDVTAVWLGIRNVASSLNVLVFIIYMIMLVRVQMNEKERIMVLNERLDALYSDLLDANVQLEEYARESVKMAETKERNRLAREIHDTIGHALTGIITGIDACMALMDVAPEVAKKQFGAIGEVARQGMTDVRRSVRALRPDALEKFDLENALSRTINDMCTATNAEIEYQCDTRLDCFTEDEEDMIYRIVQESITNAIRHGHANYIRVLIGCTGDTLQISVKDNGIGCKDIKEGFGLHHMKERLEMLGGSLRYNGKEGFEVEACIPIRRGMEDV